MNYIVITSIHGLTDAIKKFSSKKNWVTVVVGDNKSKPIKSTNNLIYLSIDDQKKLGYSILTDLPYDHYSRKNIGYLYAIKNGATVIYETDDDNLPTNIWRKPNIKCNNRINDPRKYVNVFHQYTQQRPVWPRGFPLDEVLKESHSFAIDSDERDVLIWQGLTNEDADVDSIYRLTNGKRIRFDQDEHMYLSQGCYCPFNSQNTFWFKEAFPLLFLPTTVEFRFTDILRSYIAQPILWSAGYRLGFTGATTEQDRNVHDLMDDFKDEMRMFSDTKKIVNIIQDVVSSDKSITDNLISVYIALYNDNIIDVEDISILSEWLNDL
jgi:hypothetical protein